MAKTLTAVRIKDRTLERLAEIAKREDETVSEIIRRILDEYVKRDIERYSNDTSNERRKR